MRKIILTGGGTAGHVTPLIALLPFLKKNFDEIHFFGSQDGIERRLIGDYDFVIYHAIPCIKFIRGFSPKNFKIPFVLLRGIHTCKKLLKQIDPNIIFSKGGYVSLPVCLAAGKNIPIVIHESDLEMGLANKLVAKRSRIICTAFPATAEKYQNAFCTGIPLRRELFTSPPIHLDVNTSLPTVLVMGGSQGAQKINECICRSSDMLLGKYNIIHITGRGNKTDIKAPPGKGKYIQTEYANNISDYMNFADMIISRGGAGSLFEIMALEKPSLIIPLPKGRSRGDQISNAKYFENLGCCYVLDQEMLSPINLAEKLNKLHSDCKIRLKLRNRQNLDGTAKVLEIINNFAEENK